MRRSSGGLGVAGHGELGQPGTWGSPVPRDAGTDILQPARGREDRGKALCSRTAFKRALLLHITKDASVRSNSGAPLCSPPPPTPGVSAAVRDPLQRGGRAGSAQAPRERAAGGGREGWAALGPGAAAAAERGRAGAAPPGRRAKAGAGGRARGMVPAARRGAERARSGGMRRGDMRLCSRAAAPPTWTAAACRCCCSALPSAPPGV